MHEIQKISRCDFHNGIVNPCLSAAVCLGGTTSSCDGGSSSFLHWELCAVLTFEVPLPFGSAGPSNCAMCVGVPITGLCFRYRLNPQLGSALIRHKCTLPLKRAVWSSFLPKSVFFSPSSRRHWCLHSCRMSSSRLEFSQITFLTHTGALGWEVAPALLIVV